MESHVIIRKAKKLWQAGQQAEACAVLNGFVVKNPKNAAVRLALIERLLVTSNEGAALQILSAGLQQNPSNTDFQERFVSLVRSVKLSPPDNASDEDRRSFIHNVGGAIGRALAENWGLANGLAKPACDLVMADPDTMPFPSPDDIATKSIEDVNAFLSSPAVAGYVKNDLLSLVMRHALVVRPDIERALTSIRCGILRVVDQNSTEAIPEGDWIPFLCNLALNAFQSEYAMYQDGAEDQIVASVAKRVSANHSEFVEQPNMVLPILAAYIPLHRLFEGPVSAFDVCPVFAALWREQVLEPLREMEIKSSIDVIASPTSDDVSLNVQEQYEENPYPRWRHPDVEPMSVSLRDFLHLQFPNLGKDTLPASGNIQILVAGCGTGSHPIHTASRFRNAEIVALDLSFTSIAHAIRKTEELGLSTIRYVQGDLLHCDQIGRKFDLVESIGVLHHLEQPALGFRKLVEVLKPGGFMRLALYSRAARSYIRAGREFVGSRGYEATTAGIRQCRADLIALQGKEPAAEIVKDFDFYSASGCRDLIMHVQEHQYDLNELRHMIEAEGMTLLGFTNMPGQIRRAYTRRFPSDPEMSDWDKLRTFEADNEDAFSGMYGFWLHKPESV